VCRQCQRTYQKAWLAAKDGLPAVAKDDLPAVAKDDLPAVAKDDLLCSICGRQKVLVRRRGDRPYWLCNHGGPMVPAPRSPPPTKVPEWVLMLQNEKDFETRIMWECLIELQGSIGYETRNPLYFKRHALTLFRITKHRRLYDLLQWYGWHVETGGALLNETIPPWKMTRLPHR